LPLEPFPQRRLLWFVRFLMKKEFRSSPLLKLQSHPLTALGRRGLSSVAAQQISDLLFLTPVGVSYGPLKIFQGKMCPKKTIFRYITAFVQP
jgi:hypothetical protein